MADERDPALIHIEYIRQTLDRVEAKVSTVSQRLGRVEQALPQKLDERLRNLETWRAKAAAIAAMIGALSSYAVTAIWDWLRGGRA